MAEASSPKSKSPKTPTSPKKEPSQGPQIMSTEKGDAPDTMEKSDGAGASWGGWFSDTFVSAKEKSTEMFNYLKQDLSEFSETMQEAGRDLRDKLKLEDTAKSAANVVESVGGKVNEVSKVVLEQMSTIFGIGPDDDDEELVFGQSSPRNKVRAKIYQMTYDDSLFLVDPKDLDAYENWMSHFDLEEENEETVNLLSHNASLQEQYTRLVPGKVSHLVFWHRFYYLVHVMVEAEKDKQRKQAACTQPVSSTSATISSESDLNAQTDTLTGDAELVEISEEDQKRLLAEYEEEMKKNGEDSGRNSRRSSGPSSSSSSSFAFVTHDASTDEVKIE